LPWHIEKGGGTCAADEWAVIKDSDGSTEGCHPTQAEAEDQMAALYASENAQAILAEAAGRRLQGLGQRSGAPKEAARLLPFGASFRAKLLDDGEHAGLHQLDGYASITDRAYEMWDLFGPYTEVVAGGAFDETVAADPDVAFLVNHRGVTMARTTAKTLELEADALGLRTRAFLNPKRQDVRDLVVAIDDKHITEMSFAFIIEDGEWSDDWETYTIRKVNLDRGDVSAVNYGANPYTSVAARAREVLADLDRLPAGAARAALQRLTSRADVAEIRPPTPPEPEPGGISLELARALFEVD